LIDNRNGAISLLSFLCFAITDDGGGSIPSSRAGNGFPVSLLIALPFFAPNYPFFAAKKGI